MNFSLESPPPTQHLLDSEKGKILLQIRRISARDTLITFVLIITSSTVTGMVVYWSTGNISYAGGAAALFPLLGTLFMITGLTRVAGFRSADLHLTELRNELISLNAVSGDSMEDIMTLASRYPVIGAYQHQVEAIGRLPVNAELAIYWGFDASTQAKTARGRDFLDRARDAVNA